MTLSWLPVIWTDILGSLTVLLLAALSAWYCLKLRRKSSDQSFYQYLSFLTFSFVLFAVSRSFGHLVKQVLSYRNQQDVWALIAPFSGAVNTATFIVIFSFGLYFAKSRQIHRALERHKKDLTSLVAERTRELTHTNRQLSKEIEERIRTENELEKNISEFSAVMDAIDYGVLFLDDKLNARIVNQAFRDIWRIPDDFVAGRPSMHELMAFNRLNNMYDIPDEEFEQYMDEREARVREGAIAPEEFKLKNGRVLQYQCVALPDGWRMLTYFDITELKKTQEKLADSQKMEAIGMMAGGVAHDLNNILSGVVGYPDLLLMDLPEESNLRGPLNIIKGSGQRAADVVADLLTVARGAAGIREVVALNSLIVEHLHSPECLKMKSLHAAVQITTDLASNLSHISCSPVHIKKCLMNLLVNASEAIDGQGQIVITTRNLHIDEPVAGNQYMNSGEYVVLGVTDTGKGIAEENIGHIFEPFYTKKIMGRSGTGLGLAIVWNTLQEHGGVVTVESNSRGTKFELYFPVTREDISEQKGENDFNRLQGAGELILIVDDEKQQRDIGAKMLLKLGYRVETVSSGEEAVEYARDNSVDLLVLDMIMDPGINGRATYEQIVQLRPGQRAIITSGFSENEEVQKAQKLGAGKFLRKPYTYEQLAVAVKRGLRADVSQPEEVISQLSQEL